MHCEIAYAIGMENLSKKELDSIVSNVSLFLWHWQSNGMSGSDAANLIVRYVLEHTHSLGGVQNHDIHEPYPPLIELLTQFREEGS